MPYNTRSVEPTPQQVEEWLLVNFPCDGTYGYFKASLCRPTSYDPNMVKIKFNNKTYEAVIMYRGLKDDVK